MAAWKDVQQAEPGFATFSTDDRAPQSLGIRRRPSILLVIALVVVGAVAATAILLTAGFTRPPQSGSTVTANRSCTLTGTARAPGGTLTVCAQYAVSQAGLVHLRSVWASYRAAKGYAIPYFTVTLANAVTGLRDDRVSGPTDDRNGVRSYRSRFAAFRGAFSAPETMVVTLMATEYDSNRPLIRPVASVAMVLSRHAFR